MNHPRLSDTVIHKSTDGVKLAGTRKELTQRLIAHDWQNGTSPRTMTQTVFSGRLGCSSMLDAFTAMTIRDQLED